MKQIILLLVLLSLGFHSFSQSNKDYLQESQEEFDQRMKWFTDAKFGMFIHFGLYSQLGGVWMGDTIGGYAEWIQARADIPAQEYAMLTHAFNPQDFDAEAIAALAKEAGMKYIVITTKHHEGFCLWDSKYTNFDVSSTPFRGRDILAELSEACRKHGLRFGTYYSLIDWHHITQQRNATGHNHWTHWALVQMKAGKRPEYIEYMKNQIKELIENYDSDIMWFDGDWVEWWNNDVGVDLYNYIRGLKPEIIINNRVAKRNLFKKDFGTPEQFHPDNRLNHVWEACYTMNKSWGYKSSDDNWKSAEIIYDKLKDINGNGGNLLLNIGPDGEGKVPGESVEILKKVGKMLQQE